MMADRRPALIEQTSKKWKAYQLGGAGVILVGLALLVLAIKSQSTAFIYSAAFVSGLGVLVILWARTMAWWHHG